MTTTTEKANNISSNTQVVVVNKPNPFQTALWIGGNVISTVSIVFVNKTILTKGQQVVGKLTVSLTVFHFLCTTATLYLASRLQIF